MRPSRAKGGAIWRNVYGESGLVKALELWNQEDENEKRMGTSVQPRRLPLAATCAFSYIDHSRSVMEVLQPK